MFIFTTLNKPLQTYNRVKLNVNFHVLRKERELLTKMYFKSTILSWPQIHAHNCSIILETFTIFSCSASIHDTAAGFLITSCQLVDMYVQYYEPMYTESYFHHCYLHYASCATAIDLQVKQLQLVLQSSSSQWNCRHVLNS